MHQNIGHPLEFRGHRARGASLHPLRAGGRHSNSLRIGADVARCERVSLLDKADPQIQRIYGLVCDQPRAKGLARAGWIHGPNGTYRASILRAGFGARHVDMPEAWLRSVKTRNV